MTRRIAPIARLLGIEPPVSRPPALAQRASARTRSSARDSFFGAVRACLEALAHGEPLVLAWEDIHWADEGMLDLIEYLSQWLRAPVLQVCLARDELLERRPGWGASRRTTTSLFLDPLAPADTRELISGLLRGPGAAPDVLDALAERADGNPLFAEEMVQRLAEEGQHQGRRAARHGAGPACRAAGFAGPARAPARRARGGRRSDLLGGRARARGGGRGRRSAPALARLREKDIIVPGEGTQLADEQELAFKHVLIRDVAYAMLPKAVRARKHFEVGVFIERRARERRDEVVALLAEHYGRAATLGEEVRLGADELAPLRDKALHFLEAAGDAASALYSNHEALAHYEAALALGTDDPAGGRASARSRATSRCDWGASTPRSRCGSRGSSTTAARTTSSTSPSCTARSAPRSRTRAIARRRSSTTSRAST